MTVRASILIYSDFEAQSPSVGILQVTQLTLYQNCHMWFRIRELQCDQGTQVSGLSNEWKVDAVENPTAPENKKRTKGDAWEEVCLINATNEMFK